ncbi:MAG TPA: cobalamin-binding protein [Bacteroidota bacterium]|nr:cobalamin-binding protein [Bacteroidota bacterium]
MLLCRVIPCAALAPILFLHSGLRAQISVVDDIQRTVTLARPAVRIVSLAPSITECLFALGAGDQVKGVTDFCNYPPEARGKTHVGGMINPSIEAVVGLEPDLVVLSMEGNVREDFRRLTSFGTPVFVSNPRTLEGIYSSLRALGALTGRADSARHLVARLQSREDAVRSAARGALPVRVLLLVSLQPLMCAGGNTFIDELIRTAGGTNLAARARGTYPAYSRESVIADDPDVIIVTSDILSAVAALKEMFPEWGTVGAVRNDRVFSLDADLVSRPGPRALDALETLFHLLHTPR